MTDEGREQYQAMMKGLQQRIKELEEEIQRLQAELDGEDEEETSHLEKMADADFYGSGRRYGPDYFDQEEFTGEPDFADPGGTSALRAGVRNRPCPTCKSPNRLTEEDVRRGYQCDPCADAVERGLDREY